MPLIKDIQEKNFVALKDYVGERIANIVAGKITQKKDDFLNKVRGISEKMNDPADKDKDKVKPKEKESEKEPDDDPEGEEDSDTKEK